jgi:hypothetical protein
MRWRLTVQERHSSLDRVGQRIQTVRRKTGRSIRDTRLTEAERTLLAKARYQGSPHHKKSPSNFGLIPPTSPRRDKTLCDEAGVSDRATAEALFEKALEQGLVSEQKSGEGYPKQLWVVADDGRVFELMYGSNGCYHGYPLRKSDPFAEEVRERWRQR